jgi:hypothetical protein
METPAVKSDDEIKITPEMIDAGAKALRAYSLDDERMSHGESGYLVEKILRAALLASPPIAHLPSKVVKR